MNGMWNKSQFNSVQMKIWVETGRVLILGRNPIVVVKKIGIERKWKKMKGNKIIINEGRICGNPTLARGDSHINYNKYWK